MRCSVNRRVVLSMVLKLARIDQERLMMSGHGVFGMKFGTQCLLITMITDLFLLQVRDWTYSYYVTSMHTVGFL